MKDLGVISLPRFCPAQSLSCSCSFAYFFNICVNRSISFYTFRWGLLLFFCALTMLLMVFSIIMWSFFSINTILCQHWFIMIELQMNQFIACWQEDWVSQKVCCCLCIMCNVMSMMMMITVICWTSIPISCHQSQTCTVTQQVCCLFRWFALLYCHGIGFVLMDHTALCQFTP